MRRGKADRVGVSREQRDALSRRTDLDGIVRVTGYLLVLGASAWLAHSTLGSVWVVPAFLLYGAIWSFANALAHECSHGTAFRTRWLNETVLWLAGALNGEEPEMGRWIHRRHHAFTQDSERDSELDLPAPLARRTLLVFCLGVATPYTLLKRLFQHSVGYISPAVRSSVPEAAFPKLIVNARILLAVHLLPVGLAVGFATWWPVIMYLLPRFCGGWAWALFQATQHAGLALDVDDYRLSTRTMYVNPVFRFLYWNMNYHVEHHVHPNVPFHALPRLHAAIKDQTPPPTIGLRGAYREIFSAMREQRRDPRYVLPRDFPVSGGTA